MTAVYVESADLRVPLTKFARKLATALGEVAAEISRDLDASSSRSLRDEGSERASASLCEVEVERGRLAAEVAELRRRLAEFESASAFVPSLDDAQLSLDFGLAEAAASRTSMAPDAGTAPVSPADVESKILAFVGGRRGGFSMTAAAAAAGVGRNVAGRHVRDLVGRGLLERTGGARGPTSRVRLTPAGRRLSTPAAVAAPASPADVKSRILAFVGERSSGFGVTAVAAAIGVRPTTTGRHVRELVSGGLLERTGGVRGRTVRYRLPSVATSKAETSARKAEVVIATSKAKIPARKAEVAVATSKAEIPVREAEVAVVTSWRAAESAFADGDWPRAAQLARDGLAATGGGAYAAAVRGGARSDARLLLEALRLRGGETQGVAAAAAREAVSVTVPPRDRPSEAAARRGVVVVVGGIGKNERKYKDVVVEFGCDLVYAEHRLPSIAKADGVVVFTTVVSHSLKAQAAAFAKRHDVPIRYVAKPSVSSLRVAVGDMLTVTHDEEMG